MKKILGIIAVAIMVFAPVSGAAVVTNARAGVVGGDYAGRDSHGVYLVPFTYDARAAGQSLSATGDTAIVLQIRSNSFVRSISYSVVVSNGSACLFNITDGRSATQFVEAVVGTGELVPTKTGSVNVEFYPSNGTLCIYANVATTGLVVKGKAEIIDYDYDQ